MEKIYITCPHYGRQLARLMGEIGQHQWLRHLGDSRVSTDKNALGEELAWIRCPKCKHDKFINPALRDRSP